MAATESSSKRGPLGACAYERQLTTAECLQVERTTRQLAHLDGFVHVWVHDARAFAHGRESDVPSFSLRLHPTLPVAEVRSMVERRFEELSAYRERVDGPLQLFFDGRMLDDGALMAEYTHTPQQAHGDEDERSGAGLQLASRLTSWPRPYAGILWVVPFRRPPPRKEIWGNGTA
ncbi:hypothetical protein P43SY_009660 [Pythium insidiosum]|uniref:Ubiquitin-like domain-containing protein n=1 Tax=Pythium insidiosum TaxID=114742 RepID=A0AAD5Q4H8_PYTIN|nr:hypothetical protein P43SY_009660 [Pythium insidiosum]